MKKKMTMVGIECILDTVVKFNTDVAKLADELDPTKTHPVLSKQTILSAYQPLIDLLDKQPKIKRDLYYSIIENMMTDAGTAEYIATLGDTYDSVVKINAERITNK